MNITMSIPRKSYTKEYDNTTILRIEDYIGSELSLVLDQSDLDFLDGLVMNVMTVRHHLTQLKHKTEERDAALADVGADLSPSEPDQTYVQDKY